MHLHYTCYAIALQDYCKVTTLAILVYQSGCKVATSHACFALPTRPKKRASSTIRPKIIIDYQILNASIMQLHSKCNARYMQRKGKYIYTIYSLSFIYSSIGRKLRFLQHIHNKAKALKKLFCCPKTQQNRPLIVIFAKLTF